MYLAEPPALTTAQQSLHTGSSSLLRELRGLRALVREIDASVEDVENSQAVDASFSSEELLEQFIAAVHDQLEAAGIEAPTVLKVAA